MAKPVEVRKFLNKDRSDNDSISWSVSEPNSPGGYVDGHYSLTLDGKTSTQYYFNNGKDRADRQRYLDKIDSIISELGDYKRALEYAIDQSSA